VDEAILRTTLELLSELGVEGTTISAVVARSGVARATVHLRWANWEALIAAAVRQAMGREPIRLTGDLGADLRQGAEQMRAVLAQRAFRTVLQAIVRSLTSEAAAPDRISYETIAPLRAWVAEEYRQLAREAGLRDDVRAELVVDVIIGGLLGHLLATGQPPTRADAAQVIDVVLEGLRVRAR
jgi:AcrR family transcriptional regulator